MRRIGALMNLSEGDREAQRLVATFREGLAQLGWTAGRNLRIDYRWSAGDNERIRRYAAELVALAPDVILAYGGSVVGPLQQVTHTVPTANSVRPNGWRFVTAAGGDRQVDGAERRSVHVRGIGEKLGLGDQPHPAVLGDRRQGRRLVTFSYAVTGRRSMSGSYGRGFPQR
jgi:hypothetical protein